MSEELKLAYEDLMKSFSNLSTLEKRQEIVNKLKEMINVLNSLKPSSDITNLSDEHCATEDEYLCYINKMIYCLENKLGNCFKDYLND